MSSVCGGAAKHKKKSGKKPSKSVKVVKTVKKRSVRKNKPHKPRKLAKKVAKKLHKSGRGEGKTVPQLRKEIKRVKKSAKLSNGGVPLRKSQLISLLKRLK